MVKITIDEVYATLSFTEWKRGLTIQSELCALKGVNPHGLRAPNYILLYQHFNNLCDQDYALTREAADGVGTYNEYRKNPHNIREPKLKRVTDEGLEGSLALI